MFLCLIPSVIHMRKVLLLLIHEVIHKGKCKGYTMSKSISTRSGPGRLWGFQYIVLVLLPL